MIKKALLICRFLLVASVVCAQNWHHNIDTAIAIAKAENKPIVLSFQGSDWCAPCIKLEKNIWADSHFQAYASEHYVMLKADFPRRRKNKLSDEQQTHNNQLAERYNPTGHFPFVVVLDGGGEVLGTTGYRSISPAEYINLINNFNSKNKKTMFQNNIMTAPADTTSVKTDGASSNLSPHKRVVKLMGCKFDITVLAKDDSTANQYIDMAIAEMTRIERLISSWDPNSQTSMINRNAGIKPVIVDMELLTLIERSISISKLTDGAFDISYASMDKIWKFDGSMEEMPSKKAIRQSVKMVGYENIIVNRDAGTVFLKEKGMKIGFGAIGKGYAADMAKALLRSHGVVSGIINASGDMNTWGQQSNQKDWKVAITNPMDEDKAFALLPIRNAAVVTSGDYEKYVEFDGTRYTHIIDPRTGYPSSGIVSVTIFAPRAELADALATSVFVMGKSTGIDRINQLPNVECILIDQDGKIFTSNNIKINKT